jgi:WD40 repeat protein
MMSRILLRAVAGAGAALLLVATTTAQQQLPAWRPKFNLEHPGDGINTLAFAPDSRSLVATGILKNPNAASFYVWDLGTGRRTLAIREASGPVRYTPDGKTLLIGADERKILLWDVRQQRTRAVLDGHGKNPVLALDVSRDGKSAVTADGGVAQRWDLTTGQPVASVGAPAVTTIDAVAFSPDAGLIALGGGPPEVLTDPGHVTLWDGKWNGREQPLRWHGGKVRSAAFAPDGVFVAAGGISDGMQPDILGAAAVWDVKTGKRVCVLEPLPADCWAVAFAPDSKVLATATLDRWVRLWDPRTGKLLHRLPAGMNSVSSLSFSPDGRLLAWGDWQGGPVAVWERVKK